MGDTVAQWHNGHCAALRIEGSGLEPRGPFLHGHEKLSHPESHSKVLNVMITELFYSHILNMNRGSLHTRSFRSIHFSVFKYRLTKTGFTSLKRSKVRGLRETVPWSGTLRCVHGKGASPPRRMNGNQNIVDWDHLVA